jgi:ribosomal protein S18 acetylase RimI-like enzyme
METTSPVHGETISSPLDGTLSPATIDDVGDIRRVMQEASEFKYSKGDALWGTEPFADEEVSRMVESGNIFVYKVDGAVAASVVLLKNDERMWGEEQGNDDSALYVHKLTTGNAFRGRGVGEKVLSLAERLATEQGRTRLRLDCPYDNENLYNYYRRLGFSEVRRYERPSSPSRRNPDKDVFRAALLEKELAGSSVAG